MSLMSLVTAAAAETHSEEAAVSPYLVGAVTLAILMAMLLGLMMFGKGRDHS